MSRTLFLYIFRDLLRIFLMASGALAGIMSFGGLLRPLMREGLDAGQVARMLTFFGPAMTTYSFPVAALFATAVVYGRLSADNELTACKAGGVSLLSLTVAGPALVLGLLVAITSLLFLCFIVPASTLKVERVIYSNLAKLVQSRIERTHEIEFENTTIFAQQARVIPPDSTTPANQQRVELIGPEIISLERDPTYAGKPPLRVPKEFYTASRAYVYIDPLADGQEVNVSVHLAGGFKFPRRFANASEALIEETEYGPIQIPSPIKEEVKFMDVWQLQSLYGDIGKSRRLGAITADFARNGQKLSLLIDIADRLNFERETSFNFADGERYTLAVDRAEADGAPIVAAMLNGEVTAPHHDSSRDAGGSATTKTARSSPPVPTPAAITEPLLRPILFRQEKKDHSVVLVRATRVVVRARPSSDSTSATITVDLRDCVQTNGNEDAVSEPVRRERFVQQFDMPLTPAQRALAGRELAFYESPRASIFGSQEYLRHEKSVLLNAIIAESNGRASFAVSCLILVMVGCALGMMFRSGNFLTAFAVSFIPALLSITLIIAGQRTAGNLPDHFDGRNNPLQLGLALIWLGNAVNLALAIGLLWKLGRR